ncbi:alpha/beta hydrolase [Microvirga sp. W0021]|uniref:Alpha/beta hydrolase n=1 Tax=Hohaiivirga grylli TaxID=3133970 RepID=A0ABV0BJK0_9HYPH
MPFTISAAGKIKDTFVETDKGKLFVRIWGDADNLETRAPIILLHDSLGSVELWRDFPAALSAATKRTVIAYDRLGFGNSDPRSDYLDLDFISKETVEGIAALRQHLQLSQIILFGHSVGGGMAVSAAAAMPDRVVAVITESAQAFVEDRTVEGIKDAQLAFEIPEQVERLAKYHGTKARWVLDAWVKSWLSPEFASWTLEPAITAVRCPVFAIHGDFDEYGSLIHPEKISSSPLCQGEMEIFHECGHLPHRERPEAVLRVVSSFLERRLGA